MNSRSKKRTNHKSQQGASRTGGALRQPMERYHSDFRVSMARNSRTRWRW